MRSRLTFLNPGALFPEAARHLLHAVGRRFRDGRCAQVAASLAFTTLLSLVPFVTLVAVVFSRLPQSQRLDAALRGFLLDNLLPEKAGKVIATYAVQFSQKATNLTIAGALALILTTVLLMRTIDQVINEIWMIRSRRPWATRLAAYWVALSFGPLLLAGGVVLASAMLSISLSVVNEPVWLQAVGLKLISTAFMTGLFGLLYYAVPHCRVNVGHALLAGFLTAVGLMLMQRLLGLYLVHFPSYTLVYGAFAAVPILLVWLYLSWIVVLLGAVVAAVLPSGASCGGVCPTFRGGACMRRCSCSRSWSRRSGTAADATSGCLRGRPGRGIKRREKCWRGWPRPASWPAARVAPGCWRARPTASGWRRWCACSAWRCPRPSRIHPMRTGARCIDATGCCSPGWSGRRIFPWRR